MRDRRGRIIECMGVENRMGIVWMERHRMWEMFVDLKLFLGCILGDTNHIQ